MLMSIRRGVFETNSSSTHSITICSKEEYEAFQNGDLLLNRWTDKFVKKDKVTNEKYPEECQTYDEYFDDEYLETFETSYTTKAGDEVVAFGKYGYDG